jgi:hypothetical protein
MRNDEQETLAHSSVKITLDIYSHTPSDRQARSLRRMDQCPAKTGLPKGPNGRQIAAGSAINERCK